MIKRLPSQAGGRRGFSLVEMLVVLVIIAVLSAVSMQVYLGHRPKGAPPGTADSPMDRANGIECSSNIRQIHEAIMAAQVNLDEGKFPASLAELKLPAEMLSCPVGHVPYVYDPATGAVHCPYPGHEGYH